MNDPENVRTLLRRLIRERGLTPTQISRALGKNHAYIHQFLRQGKPRHLPDAVRSTLGRLLGVSPKELGGPIQPDDDLDLRLARRSNRLTARILDGTPWEEGPVSIEVWAAIYALLERDRAGHRITDDRGTTTILRRLAIRLSELVKDQRST